jgi:hypothetical protein
MKKINIEQIIEDGKIILIIEPEDKVLLDYLSENDIELFLSSGDKNHMILKPISVVGGKVRVEIK